MKAPTTAAFLLCASTACLAQSPSEEFDSRIPSGRSQPALQLGGAAPPRSGQTAGESQVRVMDVGRRAPRSSPNLNEDQSEREYQQGRAQQQDSWNRRTYSQPNKQEQIVCEGSPPVCSKR